MNGNRAPALLLLGAMLALLPLSLETRDGRQPSGPAPAEAPATAQEPGKAPAPQASPWFGPARLIAEITGERWDGTGDAKERWLRFAERAKSGGFKRFDPLIALVPCPVDSNLSADFDQAVAALQEAYADAGYLLEGWWLPWSTDADKERLHEQAPGLMVFRRYDRPELAVVLVVGEVPARGLHRVAFREAVAAVQQWETARPVTVRVLGPALSDSAQSLQLAIAEWGPATPLSFQVVSGTARARSVQELPWKSLQPRTDFDLTVVPEGELQTRARRFFEKEMGWNLGRIALLTEADRAYGQPFLIPENAENSVLVRFPPGIAGVRNAWDQDQRPRETKPEAGSVRLPETTLDLRLGDRGRPIIVPEQSSLTAASRDLAIANLLATLSDRKISYIGVLASDTRDAVFLVDRTRRFAPSALLFMVNNDLLYTHPRLGPTMNGILVVSGFPLFAGNEPARPAPAGEQRRRYLSQFASDLHQGIYLAARRLIASSRDEKAPPENARVWVSAVGNGSLWPVAGLDANRSGPVCRPWSFASSARGAAERLSARAGTKLLISALVIMLLTLMLMRHATPPQRAGWRTWWLLAAAASTLGLAVGVLTVLGSLPYRRLGVAIGWDDWKVILGGLLLLGNSVALVAMVVRAVCMWNGHRRRAVLFGEVVLLVILVLYFLDPILCRLWMLGGFEFFLRRAFTFSSGLSPLVSLAWLGAALYLWAFVELRRERMQARQDMDWPGEGPPIPAFERCRELAAELRLLLDGPWPGRPGRSVWVLVLPILLSLPFFAFLVTVHPIAEPRRYGQIFLLLLGFTFFVAAYSFCRFLGAWMLLRKILEQLALPHPPGGFDDDLANVVGWNPMKSFGWQIPRFTMAILLADQVHRLKEAGKLSSDFSQRVAQHLERGIVAYRDQDFEGEVEARRELRRNFEEAYRELANSKTDDSDIQRFIALRLVAYIRYIFAHLRGCLIAAGACGFPVLAAASTYAFEPNELISNGIWALLLVAVLITMGVFFLMDRNRILSLISGTTPGKVQPSLQLFQNVMTYGVVPLLGLIASQFPQAGRYIVSLINPMLRAVGGGP